MATSKTKRPTKAATIKKPTTKKTTAKKPVTKKATPRKVVKQPSKAEQLVRGVKVMHDEALELAESVVFMASKLEEARKTMANEPLVVPYDNGGGQTGLRENPHFAAFEKLMNTYARSLNQLKAIVETGETSEKGLSVMAELTTIAGRRIG